MKITRLLFAFLFCLASVNLNAQIDVEKKVENQTNNKANREVDQTINKGLNAVGDGVKGLFKKKKPTESKPMETAKENGKGDQKKEEQQNVKQAFDSPSLQSYSKFDFIPGEKVIFYDDFGQDNVGDFPALWNTNGSAEVVTTNLFPGKWMKFVSREAVWSDQLLKLPENYTIEFDAIPIKGTEGGMGGYGFRLMQSINEKSYDTGAIPGKAGLAVYVEYFGRLGYRTYINNKEGEGLGLTSSNENKETYEKENQKYHISIWIQKSRVRLYQNEAKLFDLPKAFPVTSVKMDRIRFEDGAAMVSNIRIAVGVPDMRNKLMTEGRLVTYGIYFDVNKDIVKPESYGTLKEIANILNEVPDVKVKIVGHTDSDGDDAKNMDLSKRRAASVKAELAKSFGVNADRLDTDGMGESQPVAANDTPVNKALNRRVEFIKL
jgi:OmpA-OmpF porin, OOP family